MIKRILVDLSDTKRVAAIVRHAVALGCRHRAELTAVVSDPVLETTRSGWVPEMSAAAWARALQRQHQVDAQPVVGEALEYLRSACVSHGLPFSIVERNGNAFQTTIERFRYQDLLVCGTDASFDDFHFEPGTEELLRLVEAGVRPLLAVSEAYRPIERVLIAQTSALDSGRTLKRLIRFRPWPDMSLKIVAFRGTDADPSALLMVASHYCHRHGVEAEVEVLPGTMCQQLLQHAEEWDADLIVIGNSEHSRLARWFFGGTVMNIIRESDRSLFISQ